MSERHRTLSARADAVALPGFIGKNSRPGQRTTGTWSSRSAASASLRELQVFGIVPLSPTQTALTYPLAQMFGELPEKMSISGCARLICRGSHMACCRVWRVRGRGPGYQRQDETDPKAAKPSPGPTHGLSLSKAVRHLASRFLCNAHHRPKTRGRDNELSEKSGMTLRARGAEEDHGNSRGRSKHMSRSVGQRAMAPSTAARPSRPHGTTRPRPPCGSMVRSRAASASPLCPVVTAPGDLLDNEIASSGAVEAVTDGLP